MNRWLAWSLALLLVGCARSERAATDERTLLDETQVGANDDLFDPIPREQPEQRVALRPASPAPPTEEEAIRIARETVEFRSKWPQFGWADRAEFIASRWGDHWLVFINSREADPPGLCTVGIDAEGNVVSYAVGL